MTRCTSMGINFAHAFSLQEVEGVIAAGTYWIDSEEEPIDGLRSRRQSGRLKKRRSAYHLPTGPDPESGRGLCEY